MKTYKNLHRINKLLYLINFALYIILVTFYFGMLFQILLGFAQIVMALILTFDTNELSKGTKKRIVIYWILVAFAAIFILINFKYGNDFGNFIFLFLYPMIIATYFYFVTANLHNDSFLIAQWNNLVLVNYVINPEILKKYIPKGTELDVWNGKCYVSLVGFMFEEVKIMGVKIPFHINFEEVNLRFYVKRFENGGWKRGVVFIKEIVPKPALSIVANTIYKEHYETLPMQHYVNQKEDATEFVYQWKTQNKWQTIIVETENNEVPIEVGSEAEFITEHYFGYTQVNAETTYEYEVKHPRWNQYNVTDFRVHVDFEGVYGSEFVFLNHQQPTSVLLAIGSEVRVENKKKL